MTIRRRHAFTLSVAAAGLSLAAWMATAGAAVVKPNNAANNNTTAANGQNQFVPKSTDTNNNNKNNAKAVEAKPDPIVITLKSAERGKLMGQDVMVVTGTEVLTGKQRTFAVENQRPQNPKDPPKYDPNPRVADGIKPVKPGEYLKVEIKSAKDPIVWISKAEAYKPAANEEKPGAFVLYSSYKQTEGGVEVYKFELVKFAKNFEAYAKMVPDSSGKMVPDPAIVAFAEKTEKKTVVEFSITPQGGHLFVNDIGPWQDPKAAKFTKMTEADVAGNKGFAVELDQDGSAVTLLIPGEQVGKKWVSDPTLTSDAKRMKPGTPVMIRTREVDGKTYLKQMALAPFDPKAPKPGKETAKKEK